MPISTLITELVKTISDCRNLGFDYVPTTEVPSAYKNDSNLTYESGKNKKGKIIETCVLYVDIRDSVKLVEKHQFDTMGKVYTAFTKSVLKIAEYYGAKVRNIIGDRVMVVFPTENCFSKAVHCAITINHIAGEINRIFNHVNFKCGIGIDYGEMRVIKVGTEKKGDENANYKNLIWVGYPANNASRLTDIANKEIEEVYYLVTRHPFNPKAVKPLFEYLPFWGGSTGSSFDPNAPLYLSTRETVEMTIEEFANSIAQYENGGLFTTGGKNIKFEKKKRTIKYQPILISKSVYQGYRKDNPKAKDVLNNWWKPQAKGIKNIAEDVYGSGLTWKID